MWNNELSTDQILLFGLEILDHFVHSRRISKHPLKLLAAPGKPDQWLLPHRAILENFSCPLLPGKLPTIFVLKNMFFFYSFSLIDAYKN